MQPKALQFPKLTGKNLNEWPITFYNQNTSVTKIHGITFLCGLPWCSAGKESACMQETPV